MKPSGGFFSVSYTHSMTFPGGIPRLFAKARYIHNPAPRTTTTARGYMLARADLQSFLVIAPLESELDDIGVVAGRGVCKEGFERSELLSQLADSIQREKGK